MFEKFKDFEISTKDAIQLNGGTTCSGCWDNGCKECVNCWPLLWGGECEWYWDCSGCSGSGGGGPCTDPFGCPEK